MRIFTKKLFFAAVFLLSLSHAGFASDDENTVLMEIPLITPLAINMARNDFSALMQYITKYPNDDIMAFSLGSSFFGPFPFLFQASYLYVKNIDDRISVPFFASGFGGIFAGSGVIIKNQYLTLGITGGLFIAYNSKLDIGLFPVFNTAEYPVLGSFLEEIYGYFYSNEDKISDTRIDNLNYLLNISFKEFLGLSVLELYTRSGYNDFRTGFDFSAGSGTIEKEKGFLGIDRHTYGSSSAASRRFKTDVYGLRIGGELFGGLFMVDLNYSAVDDLIAPVYDYRREVIGYKDYEYPLGWLNGFPSVTLNYTFDTYDFDNFNIFVRFNTLHFETTLLPFMPDIGVSLQTGFSSFVGIWHPPIGFSILGRVFTKRTAYGFR